MNIITSNYSLNLLNHISEKSVIFDEEIEESPDERIDLHLKSFASMAADFCDNELNSDSKIEIEKVYRNLIEDPNFLNSFDDDYIIKIYKMFVKCKEDIPEELFKEIYLHKIQLDI